jgi:putative SOS response-associated peptidase YedK
MVRHDFEGRRELVRGVRWGLIPNWWKKPLKDLPATFNARVETVSEKPMFRGAYVNRRCVVPASGFYEWTGPKGAKQPHIFVDAQGQPILALAARPHAGAVAASGDRPMAIGQNARSRTASGFRVGSARVAD